MYQFNRKEYEERMKWYQDARFGMFIHWGLYSIPARGEWVRSTEEMPEEEYLPFMKEFDARDYNPKQWAKEAKAAGMKYVVLTAKHHDGFCLFDSKYTDYKVTNTPAGRDLIKEYVEALREEGLKVGLYFTLLDWHHPDGGGYLSNHIPSQGVTWDNSWDFPDAANKNFDRCFNEKIYPQVEEILRNYGELCLIWFDMPMTLKEHQSRALFDAIKKYQPDCLINSRLGNGAYDYVSLGDNEIPDSMPENTEFDPALMNGIDGFKPSPYGLYETAATINRTWGFSAHDQNWKSPEIIAANRKKLNGMGINYLLNVGPDGLGRIPLASQKVLREAAKL